MPDFVYYMNSPKKPRGYGLSNLVGDLFLTCATFGLWGIWWIVRELTR